MMSIEIRKVSALPAELETASIVFDGRDAGNIVARRMGTDGRVEYFATFRVADKFRSLLMQGHGESREAALRDAVVGAKERADLAVEEAIQAAELLPELLKALGAVETEAV